MFTCICNDFSTQKYLGKEHLFAYLANNFLSNVSTKYVLCEVSVSWNLPQIYLLFYQREKEEGPVYPLVCRIRYGRITILIRWGNAENCAWSVTLLVHSRAPRPPHRTPPPPSAAGQHRCDATTSASIARWNVTPMGTPWPCTLSRCRFACLALHLLYFYGGKVNKYFYTFMVL
jgi:hypothetical protein